MAGGIDKELRNYITITPCIAVHKKTIMTTVTIFCLKIC